MGPAVLATPGPLARPSNERTDGMDPNHGRDDRQNKALDEIERHLQAAKCGVVTLLAQTAHPRHPAPDIEAEALGDMAAALVAIEDEVEALKGRR